MASTSVPRANSHMQQLVNAPRSPPSVRHGGLVQAFGLDIRGALLAVVVDLVVFGATWSSFFALYVVELMAGIVLTFITYKIQRAWYGDSHDSALIKGLVIGLLTAIPVPIAWLFAGPGGLLGLIRWVRDRAI